MCEKNQTQRSTSGITSYASSAPAPAESAARLEACPGTQSLSCFIDTNRPAIQRLQFKKKKRKDILVQTRLNRCIHFFSNVRKRVYIPFRSSPSWRLSRLLHYHISQSRTRETSRSLCLGSRRLKKEKKEEKRGQKHV